MSIQTADMIGAVSQRLTDYLASRTKATGSAAATAQPSASVTQVSTPASQPVPPTRAVASAAAITRATPWRGSGSTASGDATADAAASAEFVAMVARARDYIERGLADGGTLRDLLQGLTRRPAPASAPKRSNDDMASGKKGSDKKAAEKAERDAEKKRKEAAQAGGNPSTPPPSTPAPTAPPAGASPTGPAAPTSPAPSVPPAAGGTPAAPPAPPAGTSPAAPAAQPSPAPSAPPAADGTPVAPAAPATPAAETPTPATGAPQSTGADKRDDADRQEVARASDGTVNPVYARRRRSRTAAAQAPTPAKSPLRQFVERLRAERAQVLAAANAEQAAGGVMVEEIIDPNASKLADKELKQLLKSTSSNAAETAYKVVTGEKGGALGLLKA